MTLPVEPTYQDFRFSPPQFPDQDLKDLLWREYGVQGDFRALSGERDQNIRVSTKNGDAYVLKIAGPMERSETIDFQNLALNHIKETDAELGVPRVIPTSDGSLRCTLQNNTATSHHVRLLTHVPGVPLNTVDGLSMESLWSVGTLIGRVVRALETMPTPVSQDFLSWDVLNGLVVQESFAKRNLPTDLQERYVPFLDRFSAESLPQLRSLPSQVIHNDLHSGNILCKSDDPEHLTGCIDFGDLVFRPTLMELASAFSEFASACPDTLTCFQMILGGYRTRAELPDDLLPLLFDASLARAILCVQMATFRIREANFDPDIEASHLPCARAAVDAISGIGRERFTTELSAVS